MVTMSLGSPTRHTKPLGSDVHPEHEKTRTTDGITPTARRANVVGSNNLLRGRWGSEGDTGEGESQESDEG